jgi:hypothetical protein
MKLRRRHKKQHGTKTTLGLVIILVLILLVLWSEFISGPNRVKEQIYAQRVEKIEKQNKHIKGISEHVFDYTTYQGYDDTTLYWYNAKSKCTRLCSYFRCFLLSKMLSYSSLW